MKYLLYLGIGLAASALFYFGVGNRGEPQPQPPSTLQPQPNNQQTGQPVSVAPARWETKTDAQGAVIVTMTPLEFGKDAGLWKFGIVFDTHSGSLDDDVLAAAFLEDGAGNVYEPVAWEGPGPGGHHREGVLVFPAIDPLPPQVELSIKNVGAVPERVFAWSTESRDAASGSGPAGASMLGDIALYDKTGSAYDMGNLAGKNVVLFFNEGLMCYPSCWEQISSFGADMRFQGEDITAVAVVVDSPEDWQREAVAKMPTLVNTLTLFDKSGAASRALGLLNVPSSMHKGQFPGHSYVLTDKTGMIRDILDDVDMGINNDAIVEKISEFN